MQGAITGRANWLGDEVLSSDDWVHILSDKEVEVIDGYAWVLTVVELI